MKSKIVGLCLSSALGWTLGVHFQKWRTSTVRAEAPTGNDVVDFRPRLPPSRTGQITKYGFPGSGGGGNFRAMDDYLLSYDFRNRIAHWTLEHLTYERLHPDYKVDRSKCDFVQDDSIHALFRSTNEDFKRSGYDRGHLAAAGNHRMSQRHVEQTFLLSNIAPQEVSCPMTGTSFRNPLIKVLEGLKDSATSDSVLCHLAKLATVGKKL